MPLSIIITTALGTYRVESREYETLIRLDRLTWVAYCPTDTTMTEVKIFSRELERLDAWRVPASPPPVFQQVPVVGSVN